MKKLISLLAAAGVLAMTLAGCGAPVAAPFNME